MLLKSIVLEKKTHFSRWNITKYNLLEYVLEIVSAVGVKSLGCMHFQRFSSKVTRMCLVESFLRQMEVNLGAEQWRGRQYLLWAALKTALARTF